MTMLFKTIASIVISLALVSSYSLPALSNGTFGSPQGFSFVAGVTGSAWPTAVDPPSVSSGCLRTDPASSLSSNCVSISSINGEDHRAVSKGWVLRDLTCLKQKNFSAAGDPFDLEFGILLVKSGVSSLEISKVTPVLSITQAAVMAKYGSTELMWMQFSQDINYVVPYDGLVGITVYKADPGGTTSGRFGWTCSLNIVAGS